MPPIPEFDADDFVLVEEDLPEEEFRETETIWTFIVDAFTTNLFPGGMYLPRQG